MASNSGLPRREHLSTKLLVPTPRCPVLFSVQMADDKNLTVDQNLTVEEGAGDTMSKEEDCVDAKPDRSSFVPSIFR